MLLALWALLRWHERSNNVALAITAGLAVSATVLVKLTSIGVLAICAVVFFSWLCRVWKTGQFKREWPKAAILLLFAVGPLAIWMLHNQHTLGDWTGAAEKARLLDWRAKPLGQIFDHPWFSLAGQEAFWSRLCRTFCFGEVDWHGEPAVNSLLLDMVFMLSAVFLPLGLGAVWFGRHGNEMSCSRLIAILIALTIVVPVLFLIAVSLRYDFGKCIYPSRLYPYLNSGRFLYGALVPILVLYVCGVTAITRRVKYATAIVLGTSLLLMTLPQVIFLAKMLPSPSNWFHILTH